MTDHSIQALELTKHYGGVRALDGVAIEVRRATIHALLGPNGAGKTTLVRVLATLCRADGGLAFVDGFDVATQRRQVRSRIGVVNQGKTVDDQLTGRENLELVGRLTHLPRAQARARVADLLERFGLTEAANRRAGTYSGGMRRRLDLAAGLVHHPSVLILDEPTTGLDVQSRRAVWDLLRELLADGTTVLLTTQDLSEAERLADDVTVVHLGRVAAMGAAEALKARFGRCTITVTLPADRVADAQAELRREGLSIAAADRRSIQVPLADRGPDAARVFAALGDVGIPIHDVVLKEPTLDDVIVGLTGSAPSGPAPAPPLALDGAGKVRR